MQKVKVEKSLRFNKLADPSSLNCRFYEGGYAARLERLADFV